MMMTSTLALKDIKQLKRLPNYEEALAVQDWAALTKFLEEHGVSDDDIVSLVQSEKVISMPEYQEVLAASDYANAQKILDSNGQSEIQLKELMVLAIGGPFKRFFWQTLVTVGATVLALIGIFLPIVQFIRSDLTMAAILENPVNTYFLLVQDYLYLVPLFGSVWLAYNCVRYYRTYRKVFHND
jgi:hypothetical protein